MSELSDAALSYCNKGWAVFPLVAHDKVPAIRGGFKSATDDAAQISAWWSANPDDNIGIATGTLSLGLVVIDLDVDPDKGEDGYETLRLWEREHGELPETVSAITGSGGTHLFYRCNTPINCSTNVDLGVDIRADGGYIVAPPSVHPNGRAYAWEHDPCEYRVADADDNVYAFIRYIQGDKAKKPKFKLPDAISSGGRNETLFKYASSLQAQGYDDVYISMALEKANAMRCSPPLTTAELQKIIESVTDRYDKGEPKKAAAKPKRKVFRKLDRDGNPTGPVLHSVVAEELINVHRACIVDGAPAIWNGRRYATGWDEVDRATLGLVKDSKLADRKEIRSCIHLSAPHVVASPATLVAFTNGVLDLDAGLRPMNADDVITNIIPHGYDANAYDEAMDRFLDGVSCGDAVVRANLEEAAGLCMFRSNDFGVCPVLIGTGANGKSTFISALRNMLGAENVSSLDINIVGKQFQTGRLLGKLANLGDDISNERLNGDVLAVFKKIVTGEWIYTDVKNGDGFEFRPYCTLMFSCNEFPSLGDSGEGMMRRLFPIPFNGRFRPGDTGFDPTLRSKLASEQAAAYLARLGIEGLQRVRKRNGMTPSAASEAVVEEVRNDNDSVLQWISVNGYDRYYFEGFVIGNCYSEYCDWCRDGNLRPFSQTKFTRKINYAFGLKSQSERREFASGFRSVRVFKPDASL